MRLAWWRYASLYDGFYDHTPRLYHNQCRTLCGRRFAVCIRSWHDQQSGVEKDKFGIIYRATLKIGVAFSKFNTFYVLCCSNQVKKMLKYLEDFSKKAKTQTKL